MDLALTSEDRDYYTNINLILCIVTAIAFIAGEQGVDATERNSPAWRTRLEHASSGLLVLDILKAHSSVQQQARRKRYTLTPQMLKWDHFNLTYKILSFPKTLNENDTRKGIAEAFQMWSKVSPFNFTEVRASGNTDIKIGFYSINHTDCWATPSHPCFDGITGELAHAFFPPHGEIHFDDYEHWILGKTHFSWKKVVWLTDLVHITAHEIGHSLGLMHSLNTNALMNKNATLTGKTKITQDELWGIWRLYGCLDRRVECLPWSERGLCRKLPNLMTKYCPYSCDFCLDPPLSTNAPTPVPPRTKVRTVAKGKNVTVRCGQKIAAKKGIVHWYKDGEHLEFSYPGYISMRGNKLSIIANAINEGTYMCLVKKRGKTLTKYSWEIKVKE